MDTLRTLFLEGSVYPHLFLGGVQLVVLVLWVLRQRPCRWVVFLPIPLVLAGAIAGLSRFVVTDREYITRAMHEIAADCEQGKMAAAGRYLAENAVVNFPEPVGRENRTKAQALVIGERALARFHVQEVRYLRLTVEVRGEKADVHASTWIRFGSSSAGQDGMTALIWHLQWVRGPDGWRMVRVHTPRFGVDLLGREER